MAYAGVCLRETLDETVLMSDGSAIASRVLLGSDVEVHVSVSVRSGQGRVSDSLLELLRRRVSLQSDLEHNRQIDTGKMVELDHVH